MNPPKIRSIEETLAVSHIRSFCVYVVGDHVARGRKGRAKRASVEWYRKKKIVNGRRILWRRHLYS